MFKHRHLLRVQRPAAEFQALVAAVRQAGGRVGWLELQPEGQPTLQPVPERLRSAADLGVLRAVAVGGGETVVVKPMRGPAVLRDLLREHFRGCALVLVTGTSPDGDEVDPLLEPDSEAWGLHFSSGTTRRHTTEDLVAALRRPEPFSDGVSRGR